MRLTAAILISLGWTAVFGLVAVFALFGAEAGAPAAPLPLLLENLPLDNLSGRAVMGGLCFGATVVAALFATVALSVLLTGDDAASHTRFLAEIAHGGAFGIAGVVTALTAITGPGLVLGGVFAWLVLLVASLLALRAALADPAPAPLPAPEVARHMAVAAAANVNVVRFPYYRAGGAA